MNNNSQQLRKLTAQKVTIGGRPQNGNTDLFVYGDTDLRKNLIVRDNLTVLGKASTQDVKTCGSLEVSKNVTIEGNLSVSGKTTLEKLILTTQVLNTVTVKEKLSVGSSASIASSKDEENFIEFTKTSADNDEDHLIVTKDLSLGKISFKGSDGTKWVEGSKIYSNVEDEPSRDKISANIKFSTSNKGDTQDRLTISANGNIGINENNPVSKLHINSTDSIILPIGNNNERPDNNVKGQIRYNSELDRFEGFGPKNNWVKIGGGVIDIDEDTFISAEDKDGTDTDTLRFITNNSERMIINSDGKLGIGTNMPEELVDINGNIKCKKITADVFSGTIESDTYNNLKTANSLQDVGDLKAGSITSSFGNIDIGDKLLKAGTLEINNNIGIGKFPARESLDVYGNIRLSQRMLYSKTNQDKILLKGDKNMTKIATMGGNEYLQFFSGTIVDTDNYKTGNHSWYTADGKEWKNRMILTSEGRLGIGTHSPDEILHVNGSIKVNGLIIGGTSVKVTADTINLLKNVTDDVQEQIDNVIEVQKIYSQKLEDKLKEKDREILNLTNKNLELENRLKNIEDKLGLNEE